jgi:hypothetical protein
MGEGQFRKVKVDELRKEKKTAGKYKANLIIKMEKAFPG